MKNILPYFFLILSILSVKSTDLNSISFVWGILFVRLQMLIQHLDFQFESKSKSIKITCNSLFKEVECFNASSRAFDGLLLEKDSFFKSLRYFSYRKFKANAAI